MWYHSPLSAMQHSEGQHIISLLSCVKGNQNGAQICVFWMRQDQTTAAKLRPVQSVEQKHQIGASYRRMLTDICRLV